jgi:serralysin
LATLTPFQGYQGGLSLGASDVDGDGKFEILFGVSVGGSQVKAIGVDGTEKRSFSAFDGFLGGVTVGTNTAGDIVVGAGPGSGPHVKVIDGKSMDLIQSFFAFDEEYTGGIDVS